MTATRELPAGWVRARLDEVTEVRLGRQRSPQNHTGKQMRPYLRAANVTWAGLDLSDVKSMNFTDDEVTTYRLRPGDVLLSEASGSAEEVGKPAIWRDDQPGPVCFQNTLLRVRPEDGVLSEYLHLRLLHEAVSGGFARSSRGVGIHHLGAAKLAALQVEIPPTEEQRRIVEALDAQLSIYNKTLEGLRTLVGSVTVTANSQMGRLRKSLLVAAFTGQLVVPDPADEPADMLLKRIAEERAAVAPTARRRRVRTVTATGPAATLEESR